MGALWAACKVSLRGCTLIFCNTHSCLGCLVSISAHASTHGELTTPRAAVLCKTSLPVALLSSLPPSQTGKHSGMCSGAGKPGSPPRCPPAHCKSLQVSGGQERTVRPCRLRLLANSPLRREEAARLWTTVRGGHLGLERDWERKLGRFQMGQR